MSICNNVLKQNLLKVFKHDDYRNLIQKNAIECVYKGNYS